MKKVLCFLFLVIVNSSCIENAIDANHNKENEPFTLESLFTRSAGTEQDDSLTMKHKLQSDVDNLMMNRVLFKDSVYVLAIKRNDAVFLGVPEDVYDWYVEYVAEMNEQMLAL